MTDLGTLGGNLSRTLDLNNRGQVVGFSTTASGLEHAFRWDGSGRMKDLGTLGGTSSRAWRVNDDGIAVGQAMTRGERYRAAAWTPARGIVDLNTLLARAPQGLILDNALGIGNDGTIIATSNAGLVVLKPRASGLSAPVVGPIPPPAARGLRRHRRR